MHCSWLNRAQLLELLEGLEAELSVYCRPEDWPSFAEKLRIGRLSEALRIRSETGVSLFLGYRRSFVILPPFPVKLTEAYEGLEVKPLLDLLSYKPTLAVVLLRRGPYALGVFEEEGLVTSKVDEVYVGSRHRKGGMSQRRFSRIREQEVRSLLKEVAKQAELRFKPYEEQIEWLFLGGEKTLCRQLLRSSKFLQRFELGPRILSVREPNKKALGGILKEVWKFKVYEF